LQVPLRSATRGLHLFALSSFAVAQPLLDLLSHNAGFLVAHGTTPGEIIAIVAVLFFGVPAAGWILEEILLRIDRRLGWALHLLLVAALTAGALLPPIARLPNASGIVSMGLAALGGALGVVAYARLRPARRFASVLALAPVVFAVAFASTSPIRALLSNRGVGAVGDIEIEREAPIVMVLFDELPLTSLLDERERIDPVRYPAFARFAEDATWYRRAMTVHAQTHLALPAMLTGRYSPPTFLPIASAHPRNLFTLLAGRYDMNVYEMETSLLPPDRNDREQIAMGAWARATSFFSDLWVLYLHVLLPEDLTTSLPRVTDVWRDFATGDIPAPPTIGNYKLRDVRFRKFIASITPRARPTLHFFHALIPHTPFNFLPSGRRYFPVNNYGQTRSEWSSEPWWAVQAYQRHLLQVEFVDRLLGELLHHLEREGLYDPALIVVSADHGGGFWPGEARRNPILSQHPEDVLRIPLLIKAPHQREGRISDRNVETIDLLPTIADHLGFDVPWEVQGCSAIDPACPERAGTTFVTAMGVRRHFDEETLLDRASLDRKLRIFGSGSRENGLYRIGRHRDLVGRRIDELGVGGAAAAEARLMPEPFELAARRPESFVLARITGLLQLAAPAAETPYVAIAVNGTIVAAPPALPHEGKGLLFSAMLPEEAAPTGAEDLEILLVAGPPGAPILHPVPTWVGKHPLRRWRASDRGIDPSR
jgi:hypothetical protein